MLYIFHSIIVFHILIESNIDYAKGDAIPMSIINIDQEKVFICHSV